VPANPGAILFTAFEPSGDQLAASVIAKLRELRPDIEIHAIGGPRMRAAGANIIEETGRHAAMLGNSVAQVFEHRRRLDRLRVWLAGHPVAAVVPVDSPAANWAVCKLARRMDAKPAIVHLVAPQLWAWAPWRIRKMRRLSDHVLCLLPFEPDWFQSRGVSATFVGHPLYSGLVGPANARGPSSLPGDAPTIHRPAQPAPLDAAARPRRLALLPGSRPGEHRANWPTMLAAFAELHRRHPQLTAQVAAIDDAAVARLRQLTPPPLDQLPVEMRVDQIDQVLDWSQVVLVVSGTATLHTAVHGRPMVAMFNVPRWQWHLVGRWLMRTRTFTLPNLIAEHAGRGRILRELVPHFGQVGPVVDALDELMTDQKARENQLESLRWLAAQFEGVDFAARAAGRILDMAQAPANTLAVQQKRKAFRGSERLSS
jgi:lipid-A-disaccharide synthase